LVYTIRSAYLHPFKSHRGSQILNSGQLLTVTTRTLLDEICHAMAITCCEQYMYQAVSTFNRPKDIEGSSESLYWNDGAMPLTLDLLNPKLLLFT